MSDGTEGFIARKMGVLLTSADGQTPDQRSEHDSTAPLTVRFPKPEDSIFNR